MSAPEDPGSVGLTSGRGRVGAPGPLLGPRLRPIALRRRRGPPAAGFGANPTAFSVHSATGTVLGYAVLTNASTTTWGGLSLCPEPSVEVARQGARMTELQQHAFGIRRGSHHCVLGVRPRSGVRAIAERRREFLDAIDPLLRHGLCRIVYTEQDGRIAPLLLRHGRAMSAAASALAALRELGIPANEATVGAFGGADSLKDVLDALGERGLQTRRIGMPALAAGVDVLLVAGGRWCIGVEHAARVRARAVVELGQAAVNPGAAARLARHDVVLVPAAIAAAGVIVVADLCARGVGEAEALKRVFAAAGERARALLELRSQADPLGALLASPSPV